MVNWDLDQDPVLDTDHFFQGRILDPDPHQNEMDPKHWFL